MDPSYLPQNQERPLPATRSEPWQLFFNLPVAAGSNPDVWVSPTSASCRNMRQPPLRQPPPGTTLPPLTPPA